MSDGTRKPAKVAPKAAPKVVPAVTGPDDPAEHDQPAASHQFPSVSDGDSGVEIAERSQDVVSPTATEHVKVYVVQRDPAKAGNVEDDEDMHARNIDAMRQALINQGMRPTGDGRFVSAEDGTDAGSVRLTYAIPVVPAAVADPAATFYVVQDDQHAADAATETGDRPDAA
jgi:hypothetical protein